MTQSSNGREPKRHPVVKWRDIDKDIFFRRSKAIAEAAGESGTGVTEADLETDSPGTTGSGEIIDALAVSAMTDTEFLVEDMADLNSSTLLDLLSDTEPTPAQSEASQESSSQETPKSANESAPNFDLDREISEW